MVQGRIVWTAGDLFKGKVKTIFGTQTPKTGPTGEVQMDYGFGLAVQIASLSDPVLGAVWQAMHEEAYTLYPNRAIPPSFAMKYKNGDSDVDETGRPYALREGYPGHIVLACTTSLPIKFFRFENGQNILINEGIKCGDYVNVQLTVKAHPAIGAGKAGLYLNPNAVQFLGYGKEIVNTPSGDQIFGTALPPMPAGASAIPLAPAPGQMLVSPAPVAAPAAPPMPMAAAPQPHYAVVPAAFQPPPGGQPAAPPMPMAPPVAAATGAYPPTPGMPVYPGVPR
jgi:hypothetical protein